jgi:hypothetical protein
VALLAGTPFAAPAQAAVPRDGFWEADHQWTAPWTPGLSRLPWQLMTVMVAVID